MKTISELREAIERMRRHKDATSGEATQEAFSKSPYYTACRSPTDWFWNEPGIFDDTRLIVDCFTSRCPITRERLEELGFVEGVTVGMLFFDGIGANRLLAFLFDEGIQIHFDGKRLNPQPRTMGDLYRLLEQLTRE
jgi:hypothetical protein